MDDRELLEFAAKAAKVNGKVRAIQKPYSHEYTIGVGKYRWNPLTNNGEALSLAVHLHINLMFESYVVEASTKLNKSVTVEEFTSSKITLQQATRRAIVRAAAEIGKEQP